MGRGKNPLPRLNLAAIKILMLYQKNYPKVYWYNGVSTTGVSFYMLSFGRDPLAMHLHTNHIVHFGRVKPFNTIYVEVAKVSNVDTTLFVKYFKIGRAHV